MEEHHWFEFMDVGRILQIQLHLELPLKETPLRKLYHLGLVVYAHCNNIILPKSKLL